jgi:hypothetical protein
MGQNITTLRSSAARRAASHPPPRSSGPSLRRYILRFQTSVHRVDDGTAWRRRHVRMAVQELRDPFTWSDYIGAAFQQAGLHSPPLYNLRCRIQEVADNYIYGCVTWLAPTTDDPHALTDALEWFIGDRMAQYGLQNEDEGWFGITLPTHFRVTYPRLQDFPLEPLPQPAWMERVLNAVPRPEAVEHEAEVVFSQHMRRSGGRVVPTTN